MNGSTIEKAVLTKAALALYDEGYDGPQGKGTWFTDGGPESGFLGTLEAIGALEANRALPGGEGLTVASHVGHLRYSLELANRAMRGENPYKDANWARSWDIRAVSEGEWKELLASLREEYVALRKAIAAGSAWEDEDTLTGTLGLISHGAWHLGAVRQALGQVVAPKA